MFIIHEFDGHVTSSVKGLGVCVSGGVLGSRWDMTPPPTHDNNEIMTLNIIKFRDWENIFTRKKYLCLCKKQFKYT